MSDPVVVDPATPTARACKALMECIDKPPYLSVMETRAVLAGWVGARSAGLWDTAQSDAVAKATLGGILDMLRTWAREVPEPDPPATSEIDAEDSPS